MFLHGHPVNARREAAGQPAVGSLWLWGSGALAGRRGAPGGRPLPPSGPMPPGPRPPRWAGAPSKPPAGLEDSSGPRPRGDHLVVLDALLPPCSTKTPPARPLRPRRRLVRSPGGGTLGRNPMADPWWRPPCTGLLTWRVDRCRALEILAFVRP